MPSNYLASLEQKRAALSAQIRGLSEELRRLDGEISQAKADEFIAEGKIRLTKRNKNKVRLFAIIRQTLLDCVERKFITGLTTHALYEEVASQIPDLPYTSFRSYLHRFQKEGLLRKGGYGANWSLVPDLEAVEIGTAIENSVNENGPAQPAS